MRDRRAYPFRPWVRRAGLSIVAVAVAVTAIVMAGVMLRAPYFGWGREPFVWVYLSTLLLGGMKVFLGTLRPVAEIDETTLVLRPLHQIRPSTLAWDKVLGTEQMIGGDRLIVYHVTDRGMRFVALNLNLVKGRRDFLGILEERLRTMEFAERVVGGSRYLSRPRNENET